MRGQAFDTRRARDAANARHAMNRFAAELEHDLVNGMAGLRVAYCRHIARAARPIGVFWSPSRPGLLGCARCAPAPSTTCDRCRAVDGLEPGTLEIGDHVVISFAVCGSFVECGRCAGGADRG